MLPSRASPYAVTTPKTPLMKNAAVGSVRPVMIGEPAHSVG